MLPLPWIFPLRWHWRLPSIVLAMTNTSALLLLNCALPPIILSSIVSANVLLLVCTLPFMLLPVKSASKIAVAREITTNFGMGDDVVGLGWLAVLNEDIAADDRIRARLAAANVTE